MKQKARVTMLIVDKMEFKANVMLIPQSNEKWRKKIHVIYEYIFTVKILANQIQWCIKKLPSKIYLRNTIRMTLHQKTYHSNGQKGKKVMIILIDTEKMW